MWEVMTAVISVYKNKEAAQEKVVRAPRCDTINSYLLYVPVQEQYSETPLTIKKFRQSPVRMQQAKSGKPT
jgi:hypothetical protein